MKTSILKMKKIIYISQLPLTFLAGAFCAFGLGLSSLAEAAPGFDYGARPERSAILLESSKGHKGTFDWKMQQQEKAQATGEEISRAGFAIAKWSDAIVPGTVLNSLVANGVYPEPYFGMNNCLTNKMIPDITEVGREFYTYWFRTEFNVPDEFKGRRVWLQFDGINYRADIWVNGKQIGSMAGMFNRGLFDITDAALPGKPNALAVLAKPVDQLNGFRTNGFPNGNLGRLGENVTMLQPAGYDFSFRDGIRDRDTGIYKNIKLFATGPVLLRNPFVKSELPIPDISVAKERISVELRNATSEPQKGVLKAHIKELNLDLEKQVSLEPQETRIVDFSPEEFPGLTVKNPRLWWPVNKGEPFLHNLRLEFVQGSVVSDQLQTRFGIRDIRSDRNTPDQSRIFYVNGKRVFLHGSNWLTEDMLRFSPERTYAELRYTRQAGVNFLRFWAGGAAENDQFYDLCDELGIMLWIEFWQCGTTRGPTDKALYRANVEDTVKRLRNHASLAYYCCSNERQASQIIPIKDLLEGLDGTRGWQPGSETEGVHDGSPYSTVNPMWYYDDSASARGSRINGLCPEYGCATLPTIDCLREALEEKDLWPINRVVWDYRDGGGFHGMSTAFASGAKQYGPSKTIEDFVWKGQLVGSVMYRSIWEVWNYNRFEYGDRFCTGMLFWYHNSPNRQVCARLYDWSLEPTAALYATMSALEPVHAQYDFVKNTVSINNELPREISNCTLKARILNLDMKEVYSKSVPVTVAADKLMKDLIAVQVPATVSPVHFIRLDLTDAEGKSLSRTLYWRSTSTYTPKPPSNDLGKQGEAYAAIVKEVSKTRYAGPLYAGFESLETLPKVNLKAEVSFENSGGRTFHKIMLTNPTQSIAFMTWLRLQDAKTGKPLRPSFYEDNFFSLLPGESKQVTVEYPYELRSGDVRLLIDGWNISRIEYHSGKMTDLDRTWR